MKFETQDRPENGIITKLSMNDTPLSKTPFPSHVEEPYSNFQELLASDAYKTTIENYRKYINDQPHVVIGMNLGFIPIVMMEENEKILTLEYNHYEELETLAVNLVKKEMGIPDDAFNFDVKIVNQFDIDVTNFKHTEIDEEEYEDSLENNTNLNLHEVDIDEFEMPLNNELELEMSKRRLINTIIQGSSKRGHYMFHLVEDELKNIIGDETIIKSYGRLMSINDLMYWQIPDQLIDMMNTLDNGENMSVAGKEEVDRNTEPPTIYVRAINFPVLVHEIIKGIMEIFGTHGIPENYSEFAAKEDTMENEIWDLRLGTSIWRKLRSQFPIEIITEEDKYELQNFLLVEMFKLPPKNFLYLMREIMKESDDGKRIINKLMEKINNDIEEIEDTDE
jgi:hypothetical protein